MKYIAPDYEFVTLQVKDVFAAYGDTGCPHDEYTAYTSPCTTDDSNYIYMDYLEMGWGNGCYSIYNP